MPFTERIVHNNIEMCIQTSNLHFHYASHLNLCVSNESIKNLEETQNLNCGFDTFMHVTLATCSMGDGFFRFKP